MKFAAGRGKLVAAICAASTVLGKMGLLQGRRATCYPGLEQKLEGAEYTGELAVTDGNFVTGKGPGASVEFGLALLAYLKGKDVAAEVRDALKCK